MLEQVSILRSRKFRTPDMPLQILGNASCLWTWVRTKTCPLFQAGTMLADGLSLAAVGFGAFSHGIMEQKIPVLVLAEGADQNLSAFFATGLGMMASGAPAAARTTVVSSSAKRHGLCQ